MITYSENQILSMSGEIYVQEGNTKNFEQDRLLFNIQYLTYCILPTQKSLFLAWNQVDTNDGRFWRYSV